MKLVKRKKFYLVTGGAGFIGSALVKRLVKEGHTVRVFDNQSRGTSRRLVDVWPNIEFIEGDIRDPMQVSKAVCGVDSVCHLAFVNDTEYFYSKPEFVLDVGIKGMMNVLDACRRHGVRELILASSPEVYQTPPKIPTDEKAPLVIPDLWNPRYSCAAGKIISEVVSINYGRKYFKRVIIFRPHNVYGPDMGFEHVIPQFLLRMKKYQKTESRETINFPIQGHGRQTRAFVYIDDLIDGIMILLRKGAHLGVYHIGTTEEVSIAALAKMIGQRYGQKVRIIPGESAKGGTLRRCPNIRFLSRLGYQPRVKLKDGLELTARWYDRMNG